MKWLTRQITLPILIGISLTGLGVSVFYFLCNDENNSKNINRKKSRKESLVVEVSVPRCFVPMIIGRGGSTIKKIEGDTSAKINFDSDNVEKSHRICYIRGEHESIQLAEAMIKNLIESQPLIENFDFYVPSKFHSLLFVDRCQLINDIQAITKAKITLDKSFGPNDRDKRRVIVRGTAEQISQSVNLLQEKLDEFNTTQTELEIGQSLRSLRGKVLQRSGAVDTQVQSRMMPNDEPNRCEGTMEIYVSAVISPSTFFAQVVGSGTLALDQLVNNMTAYYEDADNRETHLLKDITIGQTVATKFSYDKKWYRAEIMDIIDDQYEVYFLDYGDQQTVAREFVLELRTDFLSLRFQAIEFSLAGIIPKDEEWSEEAILRFEEMTWCAQWRVLVAKVRGYKEREASFGSSRKEGSPIACVDLFDKNENQDLNVGKQLVIENFGVAEGETWSTASSTVSLFRQSHEPPSSPTPMKASKKNIVSLPDGFSTPEKSRKVRATHEYIDLVTPQLSRRSQSVVEEVDLVSPIKGSTKNVQKLLESKKIADVNFHEIKDENYNGASPSQYEKKKQAQAIPGGYENDVSSDEIDFDEMEIF